MFSRWLGEEQDDAPFGIVSEEAFVASARSSCVRCGNDIEVVCIYCKSGVDTEIGDPLVDFTVFNVWAMDTAGAVEFIALEGRVCLSGDYGFGM